MKAGFLRVIAASPEDRRGLFLATANRLGTPIQNVEKDFRVFWVLDLMFNSREQRRRETDGSRVPSCLTAIDCTTTRRSPFPADASTIQNDNSTGGAQLLSRIGFRAICASRRNDRPFINDDRTKEIRWHRKLNES